MIGQAVTGIILAASGAPVSRLAAEAGENAPPVDLSLEHRLEAITPLAPREPDVTHRVILAGGEIGRFDDPARPHLHRQDVDIALDIDRFDFAIRVTVEESRPVARMERS